MKIMGIDLGDVRTGVAWSDMLGFLAGRHETMIERSPNRRLERILAMVELEKPDEIVVGLPKNMNGTEGERAQMSRDFVTSMQEHGCAVPIVLWDERGTSKMANRILSDNGKKRGKQRAVVDAVAASIILQSYLDYKSMQKQP